MKFRSISFRFLYGALLGCVPFLVTWAMPPQARSPYLLAFPAVVLSAWLWGTAGSAASAAVSGMLIEHFIFATHQVALAPVTTGRSFRGAVFLFGSVLAGTLTRRTAAEKERQARLAAERQVSLLEARQQLAAEQERLSDLAKENAVRTELALEGADLGLWEWNLQLDISRWSPSFYRLHCLQLGAQANYSAWRALVEPEDLPRVEQALQHAIHSGDPFTSEYRVLCRHHPEIERWIAVGGKTVETDAGKPTVMAGYCLDITRRKRTEAALIQTEKLAVAGRLAASIAHEINNPLEAAVNLVFLAQADAASESAAYLGEAMTQLTRVATIAQQTLRFSRKADGPNRSVPAEILTAVLALLRPKLETSRTHVLSEILTHRAISCTAGELQQVLTNIINNAVDAMGEQGTLRLRVSNATHCNGQLRPGVRITLSDSGTGMSPEILARMREPFFTTKLATGTGLGMWVVHELVERHHGTISVRTSTTGPHRGTAFSVFLPEHQP